MATVASTAQWRSRAAIAMVLLACGARAWEWGGWGLPGAKKHATDELTSDDFEGFMKDHPVTAILFYAPWCFYSQQVMPAWDTASQKLLLHDPPVHLAKIDTHRHGIIGEKYGIQAFPTIKLFIDGAVFDFDSHQGRGWQQIVKWVNHHIDRDHILKKAEDVDHYLHDNDLNVVGLFPDGYNSSVFTKSARHFDDVIFAESRGTEVSKEIAEHLSTHASLVCETVDVGISHNVTKEIELPRHGMHCTGTPRNPQRPEWTDSFSAAVEGQQLTVTRTDRQEGWLQMLQLKCCDDENAEAGKKTRYQIGVPSVVMFMPHDERFAIYEGDLADIHALDTWISARRKPMVMRFTMETAEKLMGPDSTEMVPVLFLISREPNNQLEHELREAAKQLRGRVVICLSGTDSQIEKRLADLAGFEDNSPPVVTLVEAHAGNGQYRISRKYRLATEGLKASAVVQFITDFERGALKPWLKSEPEPSPDAADGPVGVLVGTTFKAATEDTTKDVLVNFYAPWCGHCRKLEPQYKALAKRLKHVQSLRVMKLDATRNEVEGMQIRGFPTILLFPAGSLPKQHVPYHGSREPDDMVRWLHEHCAVKFDDRPPPQAEAEPEESGLLDASEEDL
mmetsp:Transcript_90421/g.251324  ORF Transcript_90421/g.251324 Transcript_90421/m.251324 type:complete len:620 (-) Transcript_90421:98-1957(-)